jgi:hypothetical protein
MYRSASTMKIDEDPYQGNRIMDKATKLDIIFGSTQLEQFLEYLWCRRATSPHACILQYSDDLLSCFNQRQPHPNTVNTNASIYKEYLIYLTGMHFGGAWCPANSKPITQAKSKMAECLFNHCSYQLELNKEVLPRLKIHLPALTQPLAAACLDHLEQAQSNLDGTAHLIGNLISYLQGCHWLKMLLFNFQTAMLQALWQNARQLVHSKHFKTILAETTHVWIKADGGTKDAKLLGLQQRY